MCVCVFICKFGFKFFLVCLFLLGVLQLIESLINRVDLSDSEAETSLDFLLDFHLNSRSQSAKQVRRVSSLFLFNLI